MLSALAAVATAMAVAPIHPVSASQPPPTAGSGPCITLPAAASADAPVLGCAAAASSAPAGLGATGGPAAPCAVVPTVNDRCPSWTSTYDNAAADSVTNQTAGSDEPRSMRLLGDRLYIAGDSLVPQIGRYQMFVTANDAATGATLWSQRWNDPAGASDTAWGVAANPNGTAVYITGQRCANGSCSIETVAYAADTGVEIWERAYRDAGGGNDLTCCVAVSPDGSQVFVTGGQQPGWAQGSSVAQWLTIGYDAATGAQQSVQTYQGPLRTDGNNLSQARRIAADPTGRAVYVGGFASGSGTQIDVFSAIAYDPRTGTPLWQNSFASNTVDAVYDMALSPDGSRLYLAGLDRYCPVGAACNTSTDSYAAVAYDTSSGAKLWSHVENNIGDAERIAVAPDGSAVFVTGMGFGQTNNNYVAAVLGLDAGSGARRWLTDVSAVGGDGFAESIAATASPAQAVVAIGSLVGLEYQTVGLDDITGAVQWSALANPMPGNDTVVPWWILAGPDGSLYETGLVVQQVDPITGASGDVDGWTISYRAVPAANVPESPLGEMPLLVVGLAALGLRRVISRHR